jgi:hypothetical protein
MIRRILHPLFVVGLAAFIAGCATGNRAKPAQDAQARLLTPDPEKSVVYLMRDLGDFYITEVKVGVDGKVVGTTSPNTFYRWELPPGKHVIVSYTEPPAVLKLTTEPGGVYYVWQDINFGLLREPSRLQIVDAITARKTLESAYLLQTPASAPPKEATK